MKVFYSIIVIIGLYGIILGIRLIYVGQDTINNAEFLASLSYSTNKLESILNGHVSNQSDSFDEYHTRRIEKINKESGQTQIFIGVVLGVVGLLMLLFGKAKYSQVKSGGSSNYVSGQLKKGIRTALNFNQETVAEGLNTHDDDELYENALNEIDTNSQKKLLGQKH